MSIGMKFLYHVKCVLLTRAEKRSSCQSTTNTRCSKNDFNKHIICYKIPNLYSVIPCKCGDTMYNISERLEVVLGKLLHDLLIVSNKAYMNELISQPKKKR